MQHPLAALVLGAFILVPLHASPAAHIQAEHEGLVWNARNAEHLFNRAGFGATRKELEEALLKTPTEVIDGLLETSRPWKKTDPLLVHWREFGLDARGRPLNTTPPTGEALKELVEHRALQRRRDRSQFLQHFDRWVRSMIQGDAPLRDRMTLFWHGFFTTSFQVAKRKYELLNQHQMLMDNSLGNYGDLLAGIVHDPAMLIYLDNNTNVKGHANENLGRELLELFSLGEGNYTEVDVREAARALTGCFAGDDGAYEFHSDEHDDGEKTILGHTGAMDENDLVDVILKQEACARWICHKLLLYFEGVAPEEGRLDEYASLLRESEYELQPVLRKLFLDPRFYREEIVAARIQGPIEFMVGICHKLELDPPDHYLFTSTASLGQCFYDPPTVKGWDGGATWITNSSLMLRGNCVGVLLGTFDTGFAPIEAGFKKTGSGEEGMDGEMMSAEPQEQAVVEAVVRLRRMLENSDWKPELKLTQAVAASGARSNEEIIDFVLDAWLAIPPTPEARVVLIEYLHGELRDAGAEQGSLIDLGPAGELILRRLAHMLFSLPEAQLG